MPITINSLGTRYHGRKNDFARSGLCPKCKKEVTLDSYDTKLYFVILYLPLIPLGAKRILDFCPRCKHHKVLSLKSWEAQKLAGLTGALTAYQAAPHDEQKAIAALDLTLRFHDVETFRKLWPTIHANHADSAAVARSLGEFRDALGEHGEAVKHYTEALALEENPDTREALIRALIHFNKPDDVEEQLALLPDEEARRPARGALLLLQAKCYQSLGRHEKALAAFAGAMKANPVLAQEKTIRKLVKKSERYRGSTKAIVSDVIDSKGFVIAQKSSKSRLAVALVMLFFLLAMVVGYLYLAYYVGQHQKVYVLNGLRFPYDVTINGVRHRALSFRPFTVEVAEGDVVVAAHGVSPTTGESFSIGPGTVTIRTSFWSRPISHPVFLINPDETAVLERQWMTYGRGEKFSSKTVLPGFFHRIGEVNHVFRPFPNTVHSEADSVTQTRIAFRGGGEYNDVELFRSLIAEKKNDAAFELASHRLACNPEEEPALRYFRGLLGAEDFLEAAKPQLAHRPVRAEWHAYYQAARQAADPDFDLVAEYRALLAEEPENGELMYLLGRVLPKTEEGFAHFERAAAAQPPSANGIYCVAYQAFVEARFDEARELAAQALAIRKADSYFRELHIDACIASGELDEASDRLARLMAANDPDADFELQLLVEAMGGHVEKARALLERRIKEYGREISRQEASEYRNRYEAFIAYAMGDLARYTELSASESDGYDLFVRALTAGDYEEATTHYLAFQAAEEEHWTDALWLFIAHEAAGRSDLAAPYRAAAVELLADEGDVDLESLGKMLEAEESPTLAQALSLSIHPESKGTAVVALAARAEGEERMKLLQFGRQLNYARRFPHHFLERSMAELSGEAPSASEPVEAAPAPSEADAAEPASI